MFTLLLNWAPARLTDTPVPRGQLRDGGGGHGHGVALWGRRRVLPGIRGAHGRAAGCGGEAESAPRSLVYLLRLILGY